LRAVATWAVPGVIRNSELTYRDALVPTVVSETLDSVMSDPMIAKRIMYDPDRLS